MQKIGMLLLAGLLFLNGCQYVDYYVVHDAKMDQVFQQAVAYGVLRGYTVKYEDRKNGLLAFKTGEEIYSGQIKTTEYESSQYSDTTGKDYQYENKKDVHDNRDKEKVKDNGALDKVVKEISGNQTKTKVSQTTSTPTRVYEKGVALQLTQLDRDVKVKVRTFGSGYGSGEVEQVLEHFKDTWTVEPVYREQ